MASDKNTRSLTIDTYSKSLPPVGSKYVWNILVENIDTFIKDIETGDIDEKVKSSLNSLVSGIPTPFARAKMFYYALSAYSFGLDQSKEKGLLAFYKILVDEWKGLVACLALDNQEIKVEKLELRYSDGKPKESTANIFEPLGMFGNLLFDDMPLWCDQNEQAENRVPFIQAIRYKGILIGGTTPESLLFTPPIYNISTNLQFYSSSAGRFTDPLKANLDAEQYEKLHAYVRHIQNEMAGYLGFFKERKPEVAVKIVSNFLDKWVNEIKNAAKEKGFTINEDASAPNFSGFKEPFSRIFNFKKQLFGKFGRISNKLSDLGEDPIEVDLNELLLDPEKSSLLQLTFTEEKDADNFAMYCLKCETEKGYRYFSLPLSEKGLLIFQDNIGELLTNRSEKGSRLEAYFNQREKYVEVKLTVDVNGIFESFNIKYKNPERLESGNIITWPNFIWEKWNKYYLYSEAPHNSPELKAFPLIANKKDYQLLFEKNDNKYQLKKIAVAGKLTSKDASLLIEYNPNKFGPNDFKYEIYESENPFKGIELQHKNVSCGYLVVSKEMEKIKQNQPFKYTELKEAKIGFDFGSNNTCISYSTLDSQPELIRFNNRRVFFLGTEKEENNSPAAPNEVLFFQNDSIMSNQVKSMSMIHDDKRVTEIDKGPAESLIKQVKGGFPIFEKNVPIDDMSASSCTVKMGNLTTYIKYNMKWSSDPKENAYKQSFLRGIWLKLYAELLEKNCYPAELIWAYPSSMNNSIITSFKTMWNEITSLNPLSGNGSSGTGYRNAIAASPSISTGESSGSIKGEIRSRSSKTVQTQQEVSDGNNNLRAMTEAEAVSRYTSEVLAADSRVLSMGFDIGGSSTDILCMVVKYENINGQKRAILSLIKQSSIKFAAGLLAEATKKSKKFHQVLKSFCIKKGLHVHGINIPPEKLNANTAPYYYNAVMDRLETKDDLDELYNNIASNTGSPELCIVNLYITGLIMFYAGQIAEQIRKTQESDPGDYLSVIEQVEIGLFGKGSRMYDWLTAQNPEAAQEYYFKCFGEGYGLNQRDIQTLNIFPSNWDETKIEVSYGLSKQVEIHTQSAKIDEIIGEEGCKFNNSLLEPSQVLEPDYLKKVGIEFSLSTEFPKFKEFLRIFYKTCNQLYSLPEPDYANELRNMRLRNYITSLPEYQAAKRSKDFDFVSPLIILEGSCYLETILMNKLFA